MRQEQELKTALIPKDYIIVTETGVVCEVHVMSAIRCTEKLLEEHWRRGWPNPIKQWKCLMTRTELPYVYTMNEDHYKLRHSILISQNKSINYYLSSQCIAWTKIIVSPCIQLFLKNSESMACGFIPDYIKISSSEQPTLWTSCKTSLCFDENNNYYYYSVQYSKFSTELFICWKWMFSRIFY